MELKRTKRVVVDDWDRVSPFIAWLQQQINRDDPIGDLARDLAEDSGYPLTAGALRRRLSRGACSGAVRAFKEALVEFRLFERLRKNLL